MKRVLTLTLGMLFTGSMVTAQNYDWAYRYGQSDYKQFLKSKTDASGNTYVCGLFKGTIDFDGTVGIDSHTSNGEQDIFVTKIDASGTYQWTRTFGGPKNEYLYDMDLSGNKVLLAGMFWESVDFDPTGGTDVITSAGATDAFITSIDVNGNYLSTTTYGDEYPDDVGAIHVDQNGAIYAIGRYGGTVDFDPGTGVNTLTPAKHFAMYVLKLDNNSNYEWSRSFETLPDWHTTCIKTDPSGNVYVIGEFFNIVNLNPLVPPGASVVAFNPEENAMFFMKMNSQGDYLSSNSYQVRLKGADMLIDNLGNIHMIGDFIGSATLAGNTVNAPEGGGFYMRTNSDGVIIGTPQFYDGPGKDAVRGITEMNIGGQDRIALLVNSENGAGPFPAGMTLATFGLNLNLQSTSTINGCGGEWISSNNQNSLSVCGGFSGTVDFDPSAANNSLNSISGLNGFIAHYNF